MWDVGKFECMKFGHEMKAGTQGRSRGLVKLQEILLALIKKSCSYGDLTGSDWFKKTGFACFLGLF